MKVEKLKQCLEDITSVCILEGFQKQEHLVLVRFFYILYTVTVWKWLQVAVRIMHLPIWGKDGVTVTFKNDPIFTFESSVRDPDSLIPDPDPAF
jgi:hypothetical protein